MTPQQLTERFEQALVYAAQLHRSQRRKGTTIPYIAHLLSVAALVLESGGDEDQAIAALLHDAIEDQGGPQTREEIRRRFGDHVAGIVDGCTDAETVPKPPWRMRKEQYIEHLRSAAPEVVRVSLADKVHNARSLLFDFRNLGPRIWERFTASQVETLWYYRTLVDVFRQVADWPLVDELDRVVTELELLAATAEADQRRSQAAQE
jgi:(p)ppGpp synthase/HD superfamily hydrolase